MEETMQTVLVCNGNTMQELKIEKGIPIPKIIHRTVLHSILHKMEIGDSIFIECAPDKIPSRRTYAGTWSKRYYPKKFMSRTVEGGVRIWRVDDVSESK